MLVIKFVEISLLVLNNNFQWKILMPYTAPWYMDLTYPDLHDQILILSSNK